MDAAIAQAPLFSVVNCAGIGWAGRTVGRDGEYSWPTTSTCTARFIEINLIGTFNVLPVGRLQEMRPQRRPTRTASRGAIVNTASVAAEDGQIGQAAYFVVQGRGRGPHPSAGP